VARAEFASDYGRFLAHWRRFPDHGYLERAAGLLKVLGITAGDPRLCASTPVGSSWVFPLTLNNRYVLAAQPGGVQFGIIVRRFDPSAPCSALLWGGFNYKPFRDEADPPDWRRINSLADLDSEPLQSEWIAGSAYELTRRRRSTFRRHNNEFLERLLTDDAFRAEWRRDSAAVDV